MGVGYDISAQRKDGSIFPVEIGLNTIKTESGIIVIAIVSDITERKISEEKQIQLFNELNIIIESVGDAIIVMDKHFNIIRANNTLEELMGVEAERFTG